MNVLTRLEIKTAAAIPSVAMAGATHSISGHHAAVGNQTRCMMY